MFHIQIRKFGAEQAGSHKCYKQQQQEQQGIPELCRAGATGMCVACLSYQPRESNQTHGITTPLIHCTLAKSQRQLGVGGPHSSAYVLQQCCPASVAPLDWNHSNNWH
jgi:hypothetical protein